jgi:hypothetical protein
MIRLYCSSNIVRIIVVLLTAIDSHAWSIGATLTTSLSIPPPPKQQLQPLHRSYMPLLISSSIEKRTHTHYRHYQQQSISHVGRKTYNTYLSSSNSNNNHQFDNNKVGATVGDRPDPSILLSSQSDTIQQFGIAAIVTALGLGTSVMIHALSFLQDVVLPDGWYELWRD